MTLKNDNLRKFLNDLERILIGMSPIPKEDVMETLLRVQFGKSVVLRDAVSYDNRLDVGHEGKKCNVLHTLVRKNFGQQRRNQTRQSRQV